MCRYTRNNRNILTNLYELRSVTACRIVRASTVRTLSLDVHISHKRIDARRWLQAYNKSLAKVQFERAVRSVAAISPNVGERLSPHETSCCSKIRSRLAYVCKYKRRTVFIEFFRGPTVYVIAVRTRARQLLSSLLFFVRTMVRFSWSSESWVTRTFARLSCGFYKQIINFIENYVILAFIGQFLWNSFSFTRERNPLASKEN